MRAPDTADTKAGNAAWFVSAEGSVAALTCACVDDLATAAATPGLLAVDTDVVCSAATGSAAANEFVPSVTCRVDDARLPAALLKSAARRVLPMEVGAGVRVAILTAATADLTELLLWLLLLLDEAIPPVSDVSAWANPQPLAIAVPTPSAIAPAKSHRSKSKGPGSQQF